jgi:hypothetical protein
VDDRLNHAVGGAAPERRRPRTGVCCDFAHLCLWRPKWST